MILTDVQKIEIVNKYKIPTTTLNSLAKEYGVLATTIASLLKRRGVTIRSSREMQHRKYTTNHDYFESVDSEEKAYFLGLLYADGCNHRDKKRKGFSIGLIEEDKAILEIFKEEIKTDRPLTHYKHKNINSKPQFTLSVNSLKISDDLIKLGCGPRKSLTLKFPTEEQVPSHLIRHFIRGHFDGDGCISHYIRKKYSTFTANVNITSTFDFCQSLRDIVQEQLGINFCVHKNGNRQYCIRTEARQSIIKFMDWLYYDSSLFLLRKYNKYMDVKENFIEKFKFLVEG